MGVTENVPRCSLAVLTSGAHRLRARAHRRKICWLAGERVDAERRTAPRSSRSPNCVGVARLVLLQPA